MVVFTSICANYLHKARVLAHSVKQHIPDATFVVCLLERELKPEFMHQDFDRVVLAKDAWEGVFDRFIFKHSIVEASTSVKGQFFRFLYQEYAQEEQFVYLDPDVCVYYDFTELKEMLKIHPIVVCPHLLKPGNIDMELSSTAHGVYNLGFLGVNASEQAKAFIDWWAERLYLFCYDDILTGIFTDQKWVDLAPCFFDVFVCKHHGYDFAPWSLYASELHRENGAILVNGDPLRFIHFSGYGSVAEKCMKDWMNEKALLFRELYDDYGKLHEAANQDQISKTPWSYDFYHSGEKVDKRLRELYRKNYEVMFAQEDPFALSNNQFEKTLRQVAPDPKSIRGLFRRAIRKYKELGFVGFVKKCWGKITKHKKP